MDLFRKSYLFFIIILAVFSTLLPQEKTAVLCFTDEGDVSVRETGHFHCDDLHSDYEISDAEIHDHDHCHDVAVPSFHAERKRISTLQAFVFDETPVYGYKLSCNEVFFKPGKIKTTTHAGKPYKFKMLSKVVFNC